MKQYKYKILILIIILMPTIVCAEVLKHTKHNLFIEYNKDGTLKNGVYKKYNEKGILQRETTYKDGFIHGLDKYYYNGKILSREVSYNHGILNGFYKTYFANHPGHRPHSLPLPVTA